MVRVALFLAYDGTEFHGFAVNPGVRTVGGEIRRALRQVMHYEPTITCAGRTDKGVHARRQVVTFDTDVPVEPWKLRHSLNGLCGDTISFEDVRIVGDDFDARASARSRTYRYRVENRLFVDPLLRNHVWNVRQDLDVDAMRAGAELFVGGHDFSSFCRRKTVMVDDDEIEASRFRRVSRAEWVQTPGNDWDLRFWIEASSFCQQMVRSIVGTLVHVGAGKLDLGVIPELLEGRDRAAAGTVAPPHGLVLWDVTYDGVDPLGP